MTEDNPKILNLISLYISGEINQTEFNELNVWINECPENKKIFTEYLKLYKKFRKLKFIEDFDENLAWNRIVSKIKTPLQKKSTPIEKEPKIKLLGLRKVLKYAAIFILILGIGYVYKTNFSNKTKSFAIPSESITLQLENGKVEIINEDGSKQVVDNNGNILGVQSGNQLVYGNKEGKDILAYNTLTIPYGKRFEVKLSDGTTVHLNSGTSLKYPVKFLEGKNREVFLTGEAYFQVTKDDKSPFIVTTDNLKTRVYGTAFNVSAYKEDVTTDVVLIEGSVGMYMDNNSKYQTTLEPGTKGSLIKNEQKITTKRVNTQIYTTWMQGGLFFRNMTFKNIVKKLERHYNVEIIVLNEKLNDEIFNGNFKEEPIEKVLSYFKDSFEIEYRIENNKVYINK